METSEKEKKKKATKTPRHKISQKGSLYRVHILVQFRAFVNPYGHENIKKTPKPTPFSSPVHIDKS